MEASSEKNQPIRADQLRKRLHVDVKLSDSLIITSASFSRECFKVCVKIRFFYLKNHFNLSVIYCCMIRGNNSELKLRVKLQQKHFVNKEKKNQTKSMSEAQKLNRNWNNTPKIK